MFQPCLCLFSLKVFVVENICVSTLFVTGDADDHQAEQDGGGGYGGEGDGDDGGINAGDWVFSDGYDGSKRYHGKV